jgi:Mn-containing catalase
MFTHTKSLQMDARPTNPDALLARKVQELIGGAFGEMTVALQYLFQGWNCRVPGKYKDLIMDIGTEELAHVEMLSTLVARLLEGAPAEQTAKAAATNPALAAVLGGQNPQHAIVAGGGALAADSNGNPWQGSYIVASGNLLADFHTNAAYEMQGRLQAARLYNMTEDQGVRETLRFNIARDTMHQNMWLAAIESLQEEGLEQLPVPTRPHVEQNEDWAYAYTKYSDGTDALEGRWANGTSPDGLGTFSALDHPDPQGPPPEPVPADPALYATALEFTDTSKVGGPSVVDKVKDKLS